MYGGQRGGMKNSSIFSHNPHRLSTPRIWYLAIAELCPIMICWDAENHSFVITPKLLFHRKQFVT